MSFFVYIVECSDHSYYCGYTDNLTERVWEHNACKTGAKYTKARRPVKLIYSEELGSKNDAMRREAAIKKLPRKKKELLIVCGN